MVKTILDTMVIHYEYVYKKINIVGSLRKLLQFIKVVNSVRLIFINMQRKLIF